MDFTNQTLLKTRTQVLVFTPIQAGLNLIIQLQSEGAMSTFIAMQIGMTILRTHTV